MLWSSFLKEEISRGAQDGQGRGPRHQTQPRDESLTGTSPGPFHTEGPSLHAGSELKNNRDGDPGKDTVKPQEVSHRD